MRMRRKLLRSETNAIRNVIWEHSLICATWYAEGNLKPWWHRKSRWGKFNFPLSDSNEQRALLKSHFIKSGVKQPASLPFGSLLQAGSCGQQLSIVLRGHTRVLSMGHVHSLCFPKCKSITELINLWVRALISKAKIIRATQQGCCEDLIRHHTQKPH